MLFIYYCFYRTQKEKQRQEYSILLTVYFEYEVCDSTKKRIIMHFPLVDCLCLQVPVRSLRVFSTGSHLDHQVCSDGAETPHSVFPAFKQFIWLLLLEREDKKSTAEICQSFPARLLSNPPGLEMRGMEELSCTSSRDGSERETTVR